MKSKSKLIVLEGPDGCGKSTQASLLFNQFYPEVKLLSQPSDSNIIGFLRSSVKDSKADWTPMERQMLISLSHCVDAFTYFDGKTSIIMDRSYLSGLVYGLSTGINKSKLDILINCLKSIYIYNISLVYDVYIIIFNSSKRFNKTSFDFFESSIKWDNLKELYLEIPKLGNSYFSPDESINILDIDNLSVEEINSHIIKIINSNN